jgi:membrane protease YdiL (CAAX protease family)
MTVVVLIALATVRLPPSHVVRPSLAARVLAMLASPLLLVVMLAANFGYHYLLNEILRLPLGESDLAGRNDLLPLAVLVICVQPAIIEELFFRYLVLGTLRAVISPAMAVGISAIMFGLAHIGVPLSIPLLVVLGMVLGYLRVATGGLAIPILFHFAHNAVVLYWEMTA